MTRPILITLSILVLIALILCACVCFFPDLEASELWKITAYCSCEKCCGKNDGITASGKPAQYGYCALNWLPFGTEVQIEGLGTFKVQDRGARSLFGTRQHPIKHIDIWFSSHAEARRFGVQYRQVRIGR